MNRKTTSFYFGFTNKLKLMLLFTLVLFITSQLSAQVTVSGGTVAAGSYTTIKGAADAISANAVTGPITVDIVAGHTETLASSINFTATGTATNTITFQKSGAGANPLITAHTGTLLASSATDIDGLWNFQGSDYVTIDGIDLIDLNTTAAGYMEYGYAFFRVSSTDGCNNNTIKNCTITLKRDNIVTGVNSRLQLAGASGILLTSSTISNSAELTALSIAGASSNNLFINNTIQNCNDGIVLIGTPNTVSPYPNADYNNVIGGSAGLGNNIINFGGGVGAATACAAVFHKNQWSSNISFNTISNNVGGVGGVNHPTSNRGIWLFNASPGASVDVNNNTIQIRGIGTTAINWIIDCEMAQTGTGNTININNNIFQACQTLTATSGAFHCVWLATIASSVNVNNNTITNYQYAGTGNGGFILNNLAGIGTLNVLNNKVNGMVYTGTGTHAPLFYNTLALTNLNIINNRVSNVQINTATSGFIYNIYAGSPINGLIDRDTIENVAYTAPTSTGSIYGIISTNSGANMTFSNNIIRNFGTPTTGTLYGIREFGTSGIKRIINNTISDFSTFPGGTGGSAFNSIGLVAGSTDTVSGNTVTRMNMIGGTGGTNFGLQIGGGVTNYIFNNIITDLSTTSTGGTLNGLQITSGTTNHVYNNFISDLRATSMNGTNNVFGLQVGGSGTNHISYNTINLGSAGTMTSTGAAFGVSGIYVNSATPTVNIKNNIINVKATGVGTGAVIALRRVSGTAGVKPSNINASNNIYYVIPGTNSLVYGEGTATTLTNPYHISGATIAGAIADPNFNTSCSVYKTFMLETGTFSENNFTAGATTGTFVPSGASYAESGATTATTPLIGIDFNGSTRGTTPDIGALQFTGTSTDAVGPTISYTVIPAQGCTNPPSIVATITDISGINSTTGTKPRLYYKKSTDANTITDWKFVESSSTSSPFSFTVDYSILTSGSASVGDVIQYFVVAQDNAGTANVGTNNANYASGFCPTSVALTAGAFPLGGSINSYLISSYADAIAFATPDPVCDGSPVNLVAGVALPGTVTVGAGATTSSTYSNPFYSAWSNTHYQTMIKASELTAAGMLPGPISSLSINVTIPSTLPMIDLAVKMAHTTATDMSTFLSPTFTQVYFIPSLMPINGENVLAFGTGGGSSSSFIWDGVSNIVIEFCHGNASSSSTMTRTCLMDNTSYISVIKANPSAATSSAITCASTSSNLTSYSARPRFKFNAITPSIPASTTWTQGVTTIGTSNPQTATTSFGLASTVEYAVTATDASGCSYTDSVTVTKNLSSPIINSTSLSRNSLCAGDSTVVSVSASLGCPPLTYLWSSGQTTASFTHTPSATTTYTVTVTDFTGQTVTASAGTTTVSNPLILSVQGDTICGVDTLQLNATASSGATINWYRSATGGTAFTTGSTYTTPVLSSDTTFYVSASQGGVSNIPLGGNQLAWNTITTLGGFQSTTHTGASTLYQALVPLTINSLMIYPSAALGTSFTIEIRNNSSSGSLVASYTGTTTVVNSGSPTIGQVVPVNFVLPAAGQYSIGFTSNPITWRSGSVAMPLPGAVLPGIMTFLGSSFGTAAVDAGTYVYYFYDMRVSSGCESGRVPVLAKVNPAVAITATATPSTPLCAGQSTILDVTSTNPAYVYTWSPGSLSGSTHTVTPSATTTYTVTATDAVAQCTQVASIPVQVYQLISGTVSGGNIDSCSGTTTTITANPVGAGTVYSSDFSTALDTTKARLYGNSAALTGGRVRINESLTSKNGAIEILNTTGIVSNDFEITFDYITTPGSGSPADGFSYSYGDDVVPIPTGTGSTTVGTTVAPNATNPENGSGSKLKISFDAYVNGANTAGIYLMYNTPVWNQTPASSGVLFYSTDVSWRATTTLGKTTAVKIVISAAGFVSLYLNGTLVLPPTALPASYLSANKLNWKHEFAGRTGAEYQGQFIDNLNIKYSNIYEYSDGGAWQLSPIFTKTSGTWPISVRYVANPACPTLLGTVTVAPYNPIVGTVTSNVPAICVSGTPTLTVTGNGPEIQWQSTTDTTLGFTDDTGAINSVYTPAAPITTTTWYRVKSLCSTTSAVNYSNAIAVVVNNPLITTTGNTRCGVGTTTLNATLLGSTIGVNWYANATGGLPLGTGTTFTTPVISSTDTFYAAGNNGVSIISTSMAPPTLSTTSINSGVLFDLYQNVTLNSVAVYGTIAGNITLELRNSSGVVIAGPTTNTIIAGSLTTSQTLPLGWSIPAGTGYRLLVTAQPGGLGYRTGVFPTLMGSFGAIVNGALLTATSTLHYFVYDFNVSIACESPRVPTIATVTAPPAITMGAATSTCIGTADTLDVTSVDPGYVYTWSPGALSGASPIVTPLSTTTYTVTATNSTSGCSNVGTQTVTVLPVPTPVVIITNPLPVCYGIGSDTLVATGGILYNNVNVTVSGTSPTTSSGTNTPLYRNFEGVKSQFLVRASELTALGYAAGQLTSLSFNVVSIGSTANRNLDNLNMFIGHTGVTALTTTFQPTPSLNVYTSPSYNAVVGANTFNFSTIFNWDGVSNILVEMCHDNDPTGSCILGSPTCWGNNPVHSVATTPFVSVTAQVADNLTSSPRTFCTTPTGTVSTSSIRPVMTFGYNTVVPTNRYTWSPATDLYIDAAGSIPYVAGTFEDTVYARSTISRAYIATSIVAATGCTTSGNAGVLVDAPGTGGCPTPPLNDNICIPMNVTPILTTSSPYLAVGYANINTHVDTFIQSNTIASMQAGEPIGSCGGSGLNNKTMWYKFTMPFCSAPQVHISTDDRSNTNFDTRISVYRRSAPYACSSPFTEVACSDNDIYYLNTGATSNSTVVLTPNNITPTTNEYMPGEDLYVQTSGVGVASGNYGLIIDVEPYVPTATAVTAGSATIDWSATSAPTWGSVSGAYIQWRPVGSTSAGTYRYVASPANTTTITGLIPGTAYEYWASYVCGNGGRWWTKKGTFTTTTSCTGTSPVVVSVVSGTPCNRPVVSFDATASGYTSYRVMLRRVGGTNVSTSGAFYSSPSTQTYTTSSLVLGGTYQFWVVAFCGTDRVDSSAITTFTVCSSLRSANPNVTEATDEDQDVAYVLPNGDVVYGVPFNAMDLQIDVTNPNAQEITLGTIDANTYLGRTTVAQEVPVASVGDLVIYPNPATTEATLSYSLTKESTSMNIRIVDAQGKEMLNEMVSNPTMEGTYHINLNNYSAGVYFVKVQAGDYIQTKKLIVDRR